eukprot:NODE_1429_length_1085_cov_0.310345.p1 type:complete len:270 gc:universal NODE_1429_length_1085_cov_0.310345:1056-247(-)
MLIVLWIVFGMYVNEENKELPSSLLKSFQNMNVDTVSGTSTRKKRAQSKAYKSNQRAAKKGANQKLEEKRKDEFKKLTLKSKYFEAFGDPNIYTLLPKIKDPAKPVNILFYAAKYISSNDFSEQQINSIWYAVITTLRSIDQLSEQGKAYYRTMYAVYYQIFSDLKTAEPKLNGAEYKEQLKIRIPRCFNDFAQIFYINRPRTKEKQIEAITNICKKYHYQGDVDSFIKWLPADYSDSFSEFDESVELPPELIGNPDRIIESFASMDLI